MTMRSFEERVRLRLMLEDPHYPHDLEVGQMYVPHADSFLEGDHAARIAAAEHHDTVDPLSHHPRRAVLRPSLQLVADEAAMARVVAAAEEGDRA